MIISRSKGFRWKIENIKAVVEKISGKTFNLNQQIFKDQTLYLLDNEGQQLVFLIQDDYLAFSQNSVLLEDVIRAFEDESYRLLKEHDPLKKAIKLALY